MGNYKIDAQELKAAIESDLPIDLKDTSLTLTRIILSAMTTSENNYVKLQSTEDPQIKRGLHYLEGQKIELANSVISFGHNGQFGDVKIGDVIGRDSVKATNIIYISIPILAKERGNSSISTTKNKPVSVSKKVVLKKISEIVESISASINEVRINNIAHTINMMRGFDPNIRDILVNINKLISIRSKYRTYIPDKTYRLLHKYINTLKKKSSSVTNTLSSRLDLYLYVLELEESYDFLLDHGKKINNEINKEFRSIPEKLWHGARIGISSMLLTLLLIALFYNGHWEKSLVGADFIYQRVSEQLPWLNKPFVDLSMAVGDTENLFERQIYLSILQLSEENQSVKTIIGAPGLANDEIELSGIGDAYVYQERFEVRLMRVVKLRRTEAHFLVTSIDRSLLFETSEFTGKSEQDTISLGTSHIAMEGRLIITVAKIDVESQLVSIMVGQPSSSNQWFTFNNIGSSHIYEGRGRYEIRLVRVLPFGSPRQQVNFVITKVK